MRYRCIITSGGGTEYDGGIWEMKETAKTIKWELVEEPFFEPAYKKCSLKKFYNKQDEKRSEGKVSDGQPAYKTLSNKWGFKHTAYMSNGHCVRHWDDDTWTLYINQCGTPYYMEPIK